jgi:two-component system OmpR family response regulator
VCAAADDAEGHRLTNYATPDIRKRCAQLGADAVFDKSNEIDALVEYCSQLSSANDAQAGPH